MFTRSLARSSTAGRTSRLVVRGVWTGFVSALAFASANAAPAPVYNQGLQADCVTGDNFVAGTSGGWYVDPGCDSYVNDPLRERPLKQRHAGRGRGPMG